LKKKITLDQVEIEKHSNTEFYRNIDFNNENQVDFLEDTVLAFNNFIHYLNDDASIIDYNYLWDFITNNNSKLFDNGLNLVIINIVNNLNTSILNADLLLQMDIEGSEYLSVLNTPQSILDKFRIIVIELHHLERVNNIFWVEQIMIPFLRKITLNHTICHTHPNNSVSFFNFNGIEFPRVIEITLLRNDRFKKELRTPAILPNALDQPNKPQYTEVYFDFNSLNKL
jgi:hypothetical protein